MIDYSGFATQQQEIFHDKLIFKLIELIQDKLIAQYNGEISFDEKSFARKVVKIFRTVKKMESTKESGLNFSESFQYLSDILL